MIFFPFLVKVIARNYPGDGNDSGNKGSYPIQSLTIIEFQKLQKARKFQIQRWMLSIQIGTIATITIDMPSSHTVTCLFGQE